MDTIQNVLQSGQSSGPYPKALKVQIVETKLQADVLNVGIADNSAAYKAVCYNKDLSNKLVKGKTVLLRDFNKGKTCFILNNRTKVTQAPALSNISKDILHLAQILVNPPPPEPTLLKDVQLPKPGTPSKLMTVSGEIVQVRNCHIGYQAYQPRCVK